MANDDHPADQLAQTFHDLINGEGFKQTIRQAWDRITAKTPPPPDPEIQQMNKNMNDQSVQDANKSFIDAQKAAAIRMKAAQKIGAK